MKELSKFFGFWVMGLVAISSGEHDFFHYLTLLEILVTVSVFIMFDSYSYKEDKEDKDND